MPWVGCYRRLMTRRECGSSRTREAEARFRQRIQASDSKYNGIVDPTLLSSVHSCVTVPDHVHEKETPDTGRLHITTKCRPRAVSRHLAPRPPPRLHMPQRRPPRRNSIIPPRSSRHHHGHRIQSRHSEPRPQQTKDDLQLGTRLWWISAQVCEARDTYATLKELWRCILHHSGLHQLSG